MCVGKAHAHVNRKESALAQERACVEPETEKENNGITFHTIVLIMFASAIRGVFK